MMIHDTEHWHVQIVRVLHEVPIPGWMEHVKECLQ
jgi:hypothetical protein